MDKIKFLNKPYIITHNIDSTKKEIEELRELILTVKAVNYNDDIKTSDVKKDAVFVYDLIHIEELEEELKENIYNLLSIKAEIKKSIDKLKNDDEKILMKYKYINYMSFKEISYKMNLSLRQIYRIHKESLKHIEI